LAQSTLTQFQILPRPRWRGFSFALHRHGAGLLFFPAAYEPLTSIYSGLSDAHASYTTHTPKQYTGLCKGFSRDLPHFSARNTAGA